MIHIAVPSYRTVSDHEDPFNKYTAYDIHVNGVFHASVRYNLLYSLHEKLIDIFGFRLNTPDFPPKKIWKLDTKSLNERREGLAKYLQGVITNPDVARHTILERIFLDFQVKSFSSPTSCLDKLEVFLPDGRPVQVKCGFDEPTNLVMEKFCLMIGMSARNAKHFGLFLCRPREKDDADQSGASTSSSVLFDLLCIRWLKNFESPLISQCLANRECEVVRHADEQRYLIVIRRVTWDPSIEEPLLDDAGALKVLYLQALNDIHRNILKLPQEVKEQLSSLQEYGDFKQFLRLCHLQPNYGYEWLAPVCSDFPSEQTMCELKVGRRQLILEYPDDEGHCVRFFLPSKRIRIWRVSHSENQPSQMSFQLEYLQRKDEFGLITLHTNQAVLLSLFLQSIADEILHDLQKNDTPFIFDDTISLRATEHLETSKATSLVAAGDDLSVRSHPSSISGSNSVSLLDTLALNGNDHRIRLISYQMPFLEHENFEDVVDADL